MEIYDSILDYICGNKDALRNVITTFLNAVMLEEAKQQSCSDPYERTSERTSYRNGFRKRTLKTPNGTLILDKPQLRDTPFKTCVFSNYSRVDVSLKNAVIESYLKGISTRSVQEVVKTLGVDELSHASVSRIASELDDAVEQFLKRPIETEIPYLYIDATYCKVREESRYVSKALYIAVGVNSDGYREILGAKLADCENEAYWSLFFDELKERGLSGVKLVISDGHKGIRKAVPEAFIGSAWQMCIVHFKRNVLKSIPQKKKGEIADELKAAMNTSDSLLMFAESLRERGFISAANTIENFMPDVLNYRTFPPEHRKRICSTNVVERVNLEIKRRSKKVGAFPSPQSFLRVAGSILMDINEEWVCGVRYLTMETK